VTAALLSWYTLACLFNSTVIRVTNEEITVRNSPFWWFGNIHLLPRQLDQLWSERQEKVSGEPLFHVKGMLRNNRVFPLIYGLQNPSQALYIEQEIEKYCNIKDRKVPGEM
ncbi:hypothetical protein KKF84_09225, partial [Myxococcota bacterium]|nr:hypothetical protein [Myxococcota bacterium]